MKTLNTLFFLIFFLISTVSVESQNRHSISGKWMGTLTINESFSLRLGFEITCTDSLGPVSVVHSLDQGAFNIPIKTTSIKNDSVFLVIKALDAGFIGNMIDDRLIDGVFTQGNNSGNVLKLTKVSEFPIEKAKRPQEPTKPYPYYEELVNFKNIYFDEINLAGTLTIPHGKGPFPAVILISGSGPNDRDAHIFGHKYFLVLADYLTRKGIAVLRTDDRGTNESTGDFSSADILALSSDVESAFDYLKKQNKIDAQRIGVLGHSHGASVAPVSVKNEKDIAFTVLMAGSAEPLTDVIIEQTEIIYKQLGISNKGILLNTKYLNAIFEIIKHNNDLEMAMKQFEVFRKDFEVELNVLSQEELRTLDLSLPLSSNIIREFMSPGMKKDLFFNPADYLMQLQCPTLIINGTKDVQVPIRHLWLTENLIKSNRNNQVTVKAFDGKNHLFQTAKTGMVNEYNEIEETISPEVLLYISEWILKDKK